ncbi:FxsA family protein, partial [Acinetobacter baumannii]
VFGAGLAGAAIAKLQGFMAAVRVRQQLMHGVLPASELVDGLLIAVAGVLLILPGIISDVLGLSLLLPPVRAAVRRRLMLWFT